MRFKLKLLSFNDNQNKLVHNSRFFDIQFYFKLMPLIKAIFHFFSFIYLLFDFSYSYLNFMNLNISKEKFNLQISLYNRNEI